MKGWKELAYLLLLVASILVVLWWVQPGDTKEGFQRYTSNDASATITPEDQQVFQVYLQQSDVQRDGIYKDLTGNNATSLTVTDINNPIIPRTGAEGVCKLFGARQATLNDVINIAKTDGQLCRGSWIADSRFLLQLDRENGGSCSPDIESNYYESSKYKSSWPNNSKLVGRLPNNDEWGMATCFGYKPDRIINVSARISVPQYNKTVYSEAGKLVGFLSRWVRPGQSLLTLKSPVIDTATEYSIFDPNGFYLQIQFDEIELRSDLKGLFLLQYFKTLNQQILSLPTKLETQTLYPQDFVRQYVEDILRRRLIQIESLLAWFQTKNNGVLNAAIDTYRKWGVLKPDENPFDIYGNAPIKPSDIRNAVDTFFQEFVSTGFPSEYDRWVDAVVEQMRAHPVGYVLANGLLNNKAPGTFLSIVVNDSVRPRLQPELEQRITNLNPRLNPLMDPQNWKIYLRSQSKTNGACLPASGGFLDICTGMSETTAYINSLPSGLLKTKLTELQNSISTNPLRQTVINQANAFNADPNRMWKTVKVIKNPAAGNLPAFNQINRDEIDKSVLYAMYFNFSDQSYTERQLRISSDKPFNLFFSPTFSGMPEFKVNQATGIPERDPEGYANNEAVCKTELTADMLKYIPYFGRRFIARWAKLRRNRVQRYAYTDYATKQQQLLDLNAKYAPIFTSYEAGKAIAQPTALQVALQNELKRQLDALTAQIQPIQAWIDNANKTLALPEIIPTPPIYDLFKTFGDGEQDATIAAYTKMKEGVLNKIAQCFYECNDGTLRIERIYDVYQVGDTIFDIRYKVSQKVSPDIAANINRLTTKYLELRSYPLSDLELQTLEDNYRDQLDELYRQEENNLLSSVTNCGKEARYVRIDLVDSTRGPIMLSQVQVIANTGTNNALYRFVDAAGTKLFAGETITQTFVQDTAENTRILKALNEQKKKFKQFLLVDGTYTPRFEPNIFQSESADSTQYVIIDLLDMVDVTAVALIPAATDRATLSGKYRVTLTKTRDPNEIAVDSVTVNGTTKQDGSLDLRAIFLRDKADTACPTTIQNRYNVARFYAAINPAQTAQPPSLDAITFTGYSEGIDAALSFNPRYNCGGELPVVDIEKGNVGAYPPIIQYTKNSASTQKKCTDIGELTNILKDHQTSLSTPLFRDRDDIKAGNVYEVDFDYIPSKITAATQVDPYICGVAWEEQKIDKETNQPVATIRRYGTFVYRRDTENWFSPQLIFDIGASRIFPDVTDLATFGQKLTSIWSRTFTFTPFTTEMPRPYPTNTQLDSAGGTCPARDCSDPVVMNSLVNLYNQNSAKRFKIQRVTKAATPNPRQCDYEVLMSNSSDSKNYVTFKNVQPTLGVCEKYTFDVAEEVARNQIMESTPLLSRAYTYVSEVLKPVLKSFQDVYDDLKAIAQPQTQEDVSGITWALRTYRTQGAAAVGQIELLEGCPDTERTANKCNSPAILQDVQRMFNQTYWTEGGKAQRVRSILRAGVSGPAACDFTVDMETAASDTTGAPVVNSSGTTRGFRCQMEQLPGACAFRIAQTARRGEEVFLIKPAAGPVTRDIAFMICADLGFAVANTTQLLHAIRSGAAWSDAGWFQDDLNDVTHTVATPAAGQVTLTKVDEGSKAFILAYGLKPAADTGMYTFVDFKQGQRFMEPAPTACTPITPVPPTLEDIKDLGLDLLRTSPDAPANLGGLAAPVEGRPFTQPLSHIDCTSRYALAQMGKQGLTGTFATAANVAFNQCVVDGKLYTFGRDPGGVEEALICTGPGVPYTGLPAPARAIPGGPTAVSASAPALVRDGACPPIACDAPALKNQTGYTGIVEARTLNSNTCEYKVTTNPGLPFGDTYKQVQFYTGPGGCTDLVGSVRRSQESTSVFTFFNRSAPDLTKASLMKTFRDAWNGMYSKATATQNQKRVGRILAVSYLPSEDAIVYKAVGAEYGVLDPVSFILNPQTKALDRVGGRDVRAYYAERYYKVVFRSVNGTDTPYTMQDMATNPGGPMTDLTADQDTDYNANESTLKIQTPEEAMDKVRLLRFTVLDSNSSRTPKRAEIGRIQFYTKDAATGKYNSLAIPQLEMSMSDISGSYRKPSDRSCARGYTETVDIVTQFAACILDLTQLSPERLQKHKYVPEHGNVCGIGYTKIDIPPDKTPPDETYCLANGFVAPAYGDPALLFNANKGTPRLKFFLSPGVGQSVLFNANDFISIDAYSFITGAGDAVPLQFFLEGSVNGIYWKPLHTEYAMTPFPYPGPTPEIPTPNWSFYIPGLFKLDNTTDKATLSGQLRGYNPAAENIKEGFFTGALPPGSAPTVQVVSTPPERPRPALASQFELPLATRAGPQESAGRYEPVQPGRRLTTLRFTIRETVNPQSKFVHLSNFRLLAANGQPVPSALLSAANPHGVRNTPKEGPVAALAGDRARRWVDYQKQPLLITIDPSAPPIRGYQFNLPLGPDALSAMPARWLVEGSADGRVWVPLHSTEQRPVVYRADFSPAYQLSQEI